jgi:hypothetical protein
MYHQFKKLIDIDITKEPISGTHHALHDGRCAVDADTQMSTIPGLFAAGECARVYTGPTGWEAIRFQICWYGSVQDILQPNLQAENGVASVDERSMESK